MSAHLAGAGSPPAKVIHVGRSDAHWYATEDINTRLDGAMATKHVGDPIPQDINQITDEETRTAVALWKVVVGTGLSEELGWPKDSQYQAVFPDGFCLRWQNSAGPIKEACMYGHPQDCSEDFVYRSPAEFIPHVLWLLSDSLDHMDCPCKPCHRATGRQVPRSFKDKMDEQAAALEATKLAAATNETKPAKKATKTAAAARRKATATAAVAAAAAASAVTSGSESVNKAVKASSAPKQAKKPATKTQSTAVPAPVVPPPAPTPAPAAPARHPALNDEPTLFRRGEMVWYQQGPAWRIGIIRQVGPEPAPTYVVVPLGHTLLSAVDVPKQQEQMRPFLTFSVPAINIATLQDSVFSQVDWQTLLNEPAYAGRGEVVGLEASKLAALEIDGSWSTFNRLNPGPKQPKNQSLYGGVFLGAEMVRLGDPIRPKDKNRGSLLEVTEISVTVMTVAPNPADMANNTPPTTQYLLSFRGIEYEETLVPEQGRIAAQPQGTIFVKDTAFRTAAAKAGGAKQKCVWTIKSWDTVWNAVDVAGRSYVTDELIGVTQGAEAVEVAKTTGKFQEASAYLNNRMQNAAARNFGRRPNRRATVGAAIPDAHPLVLGEGVIED